jgi:hypothetical protein
MDEGICFAYIFFSYKEMLKWILNSVFVFLK